MARWSSGGGAGGGGDGGGETGKDVLRSPVLLQGQAGRSGDGGMAGGGGGFLPVKYDFPRQNSGVSSKMTMMSGGVQFEFRLYNLWPVVILRRCL